jgi:hypothetical protein
MKQITLIIPDSILKKLNTRLMAAQLGMNFSLGDEFALLVLKAVKKGKTEVTIKDYNP